MDYTFTFVIPCYNEKDRFFLIEEAFMAFERAYNKPYEVIVVDDGSTDDTPLLGKAFEKTNNLLYGHVVFIRNKVNKGKGYALKCGVLRAEGEWVLTLDADMSTSPNELLNWFQIIDNPLDTNSLYIASRTNQESKVESKFIRFLAGSIFNLWVRLILNIRIADTQCGFKLYSKKWARELFDELQLYGWAHDIELLKRAQIKGLKVVELPVKWTHVDGTKLNLVIDSIKMFFQVLKVRSIIRN